MSEPPPPTPFRFSADELKVLEECNRESFYQRCVPLSTLFGVCTYYGVRTGMLQPSVRFGPAPKVFGAVVIGYLLGKLSYQAKCAQKLMALPHSKLGAMLRSKYGGKTSEQQTLETEHPDPNSLFGKVPSPDFYSDVEQKSHMDIDTDRPNVSGLDDSFRPNVDDGLLSPYGSNAQKDDELPPPSSHTTTYDELRKRNREEFEQKRTKPYRSVVSPEDIPASLERRDSHVSSDPWKAPPPSKKTNIYGDVFEK